jgi:hypothetical protein
VKNVFDDVPIEQVDMHQEQPQTSNIGAISNTSIVMSNTARTTPSNPLTTTNIEQQSSLSTTPLTITPPGM